MVFHLTSPTHHISAARIKDTVTCTACNIHCFQNVDILSGHLSVTYKETGCCKRSQSASYDISMFIIYAFRLSWTCKCFIVTVCIINSLTVFLIFSTFCIAIFTCIMKCVIIFFFLCLNCFILLSCCHCCHACSNCQCGYKSQTFIFTHNTHPPFLISSLGVLSDSLS